MQKEKFKNAAVRALGSGQWLMAEPMKDLSQAMNAMYDRMVSPPVS